MQPQTARVRTTSYTLWPGNADDESDMECECTGEYLKTAEDVLEMEVVETSPLSLTCNF